MTDETSRPDEAPQFETDTVQADRAREQGLGMGERELNAQRDPGGVRTENEEPELADGASLAADEDEVVDGDTAVQGDEADEQQPEAQQP